MTTRLPDDDSRLVTIKRLAQEGRIEAAANTYGDILYDIAAQLFGDEEVFVSDESHLFDFEDVFKTDAEHAAWVDETRERALLVFGVELPVDPQHWSFVTIAELIRRRNEPATPS